MARRKKPPKKRKPSDRLDKIKAKFREAYARGDYQAALAQSLLATKLAPQVSNTHADAAVSCLFLERWPDAIRYAIRATTLPNTPLSVYDTLSHAHGALKQWDEVKKWGSIALQTRANMVSHLSGKGPASLDIPSKPSPEARDKNVIAFALYGGDPKYCETAILNAQEQQRLYPNWTCHFYVDDTVPNHVVLRLQSDGAVVTSVSSAQKNAIPGPMWRFLAYDLPNVQRVIFRDADSVISEREQEAVTEWVNSDAQFHIMRDAGTHTELILAGLWGCIGGSLPPMAPAIDEFVRAPLRSRHFADQYFLREAVWPTARDSLLQHDSMFGFLEAKPFPGGPQPDDFHVGYAEGSPIVTIQHDVPNGTKVNWTLIKRGPEKQEICTYPAVCQNAKIVTHLPRRMVRDLQDNRLYIQCKTIRPNRPERA